MLVIIKDLPRVLHENMHRKNDISSSVHTIDLASIPSALPTACGMPPGDSGVKLKTSEHTNVNSEIWGWNWSIRNFYLRKSTSRTYGRRTMQFMSCHGKTNGELRNCLVRLTGRPVPWIQDPSSTTLRSYRRDEWSLIVSFFQSPSKLTDLQLQRLYMVRGV